MSHLISATDLAALRDGAAPVRVLDVRWRLDRPDGRPDYLAGHIPGAVYVDLDHELASHGAPEEGRHPLPQAAELQASARRWGINPGDRVVAYDDTKSAAAARAWWLLRRTGIDIVVLDGGLRAWVGAGLPLETADVVPAPGTISLHDSRAGEITIDEAAVFSEKGVLIDARAPERYRGEVEPLDPIAGHIPGAVNRLTMNNLADDGTFLGPDALRAHFAALGVRPGTPVAAYCGSGITASHTALALSEAGIEPLVFSGSWSQWSNTPGREVALGGTPRDQVVSR